MVDPVRILQVVFQMDRAGLETMLMNYYRNLDRSKIQFDFLMCHDGNFDYDAEIRALGGRIYHVCPISIRGMPSHLRSLKKFFLEHREYDIIHCHLDALSGFVLYAAKKAGIPFRIAHSHNNGFEIDRKYPLRMLAKHLIPLFATNFWACSDEAFRFMFGFECDSCKGTALIPNAIEVNEFNFNETDRLRVRSQLGIENKYVVGHVGRFNAQKNHDFLIEIFKSFHRRHKNSVLILIGTGNELTHIQQKVKALELDQHVIFLGSQKNIGPLYSAMDAFVLPSQFEGFGMVLLEAQVNGLPCLASDTVSLAANVTNSVRFLSLKESTEKWAENIWHIICFSEQSGRDAQNTEIGKYEIHSATRELQEQYLSFYNSCKRA